ncbi:hypothetical protein LTR27_007476 [Elasticomyces elasticus]|nr:hypothetical protein LTR27_007476 [Elasticomyces elasticus]
MAEIAGLIAGIVPLFNAVLDDFHYLQVARDFPGRHGTAMIRLSNAEVRLLKWGTFVCDQQSSIDPTTRRRSIGAAEPTLLKLQSLLGQAKLRSKQYCGSGDGDVAPEKLFKPTTERDVQVQDLCDRMHKMCADASTSQPATGSNQVAREDAKRSSLSDRVSRTVKGVKWALVDEHMFKELIDNTTALMADLESLCPSVKAVQLELGAEIEAKIRGLLAEKDEKLTDALNELKKVAREEVIAPTTSSVTNTWTGTNSGGIQAGVVHGANFNLGPPR